MDGLHEYIELNKEHVTVHRTCVSSYTSKTNISRIEKRRLSEDLESARKSKCLRSDEPTDKSGEAFDIKKHCLFSSDVHECKLYNEYGNRVPKDRIRPAYEVTNVKDRLGCDYTSVILNKCDEQGDELG